MSPTDVQCELSVFASIGVLDSSSQPSPVYDGSQNCGKILKIEIEAVYQEPIGEVVAPVPEVKVGPNVLSKTVTGLSNGVLHRFRIFTEAGPRTWCGRGATEEERDICKKWASPLFASDRNIKPELDTTPTAIPSSFWTYAGTIDWSENSEGRQTKSCKASDVPYTTDSFQSLNEAGCVEDAISFNGEVDEWSFTGQSGQWVRIHIDSLDFHIG